MLFQSSALILHIATPNLFSLNTKFIWNFYHKPHLNFNLVTTRSINLKKPINEPFFDEETKILHGPPDNFKPEPKGLGYALYMSMKKYGNAIAQVNTETGTKENYKGLLQKCVRTAMELENCQITPGDVISLCSVNNDFNGVVFYATQMIGGIMASFDPGLPQMDTVHLLKQVTPKIIFVSENAEKLIEDSIKEAQVDTKIVTFGNTRKFKNFQEFLKPKNGEEEFQPYEANYIKQTAMVIFSSGTTGLSKGIKIPHYGFLYQAHCLNDNGLDMERMLSFATTYWVSTINTLCICGLYGKTRVIAPWDPNKIWSLLDEYQITFAFLAPSFAITMLKNGRPKGIYYARLKDILIGGGAMSEESTLAFRQLLPETLVHQLYGQTESCGCAVLFKPFSPKDVRLLKERPGSSGRSLNGFKYKVINIETSEPLGPNSIGELRYTHPSVMNGYFNMDSSDAFDENGWIRSGDIVYFDNDYCFHVVDRLKELLIYKAMHIAPNRIEQLLLKHPSVMAVSVIGKPDEIDGDHPTAVVVKGENNVTEEELVKLVEDNLDDKYHLRGGVKFVDSLPYTPSGKVKKLLLKKIIFGDKNE